MLYTQHHSLGGSAVAASGPLRRFLSLWGLGAAAGLLSFPLRARLARQRLSPPLASPSPTVQSLAGDSVQSLPARIGFVPRSRVGSLWRSWLVGTALGGVLAACGGGDRQRQAAIAAAAAAIPLRIRPLTTTTAAPASDEPLTVDEAAAETWTLADWFSDPDTGDTLTYTAMVLEGEAGSQTAMELPTWLRLDATEGELTIAAAATDDAEVGAYTLVVTASDDDETEPLTTTLTVTLTVENVDEAPAVVTTSDSPAPRDADGNGGSGRGGLLDRCRLVR